MLVFFSQCIAALVCVCVSVSSEKAQWVCGFDSSWKLINNRHDFAMLLTRHEACKNRSVNCCVSYSIVLISWFQYSKCRCVCIYILTCIFYVFPRTIFTCNVTIFPELKPWKLFNQKTVLLVLKLIWNGTSRNRN